MGEWLDRQPGPTKVVLQEIRVAVDAVVTRAHVYEDSVPTVLEEIPNDPFLLVLGVVLRPVGGLKCERFFVRWNGR